MSPSLVFDLVARRARLLAIVVVAALVGAFAASSGSSTHHVRYLGPRGLWLAAFDGQASLTLTASSTAGSLSIPKPGDALESFSWGVTAPTDAATGQASGRRQYNPITITKRLDKYTPEFMQVVSNGETIKSAQITIARTAGGKVTEQLVIKMTNVLVSSVHESATRTGSTETIGLLAQKIEMDYSKPGASPIATVVQPYPPVG